MKNNLRNFALLAVIFLSAFTSFAQSNNNLVVFSQDGDKFTLILNGLRQNPTPETNVKVTGLIAPNYKVRILFDNAQLAPIDQNVYLMDGGQNVTNKEITYQISNTKKGMKLRGVSVADITPQAAAAPGQVIYVFNPSGDATSYSNTTTTTGTSMNTNVSTTSDPNSGSGSSTITVNSPDGTNSTTTTTTTTTGTNSANVGMNVGGVGVGINVNINDGTGGATSTTTTTTSSSSTTTGSMSSTGTTTSTPPPTSTQCAWPMSDADFQNAKTSVTNQSFKDEQLKVAKQVLSTNCMSTAQVKEIMGLFSFEDSKLDWAEYAYGKTTDPSNYYQLNDGFTFSDSVDKLNSYIQSHKQ